MGRSRQPIESLAVLPVVQSLVFLFRSGGVAFQEVGVALMGRGGEHRAEISRALRILASGATVALAVVLFTPLADVWFQRVSGLPPEPLRLRPRCRRACWCSCRRWSTGCRTSGRGSS